MGKQNQRKSNKEENNNTNKTACDCIYLVIDRLTAILFKLVDQGRMTAAIIFAVVFGIFGGFVFLLFKLPSQSLSPVLIKIITSFSHLDLFFYIQGIISTYLLIVIYYQRKIYVSEIKRLTLVRDIGIYHSDNFKDDVNTSDKKIIKKLSSNWELD